MERARFWSSAGGGQEEDERRLPQIQVREGSLKGGFQQGRGERGEDRGRRGGSAQLFFEKGTSRCRDEEVDARRRGGGPASMVGLGLEEDEARARCRREGGARATRAREVFDARDCSCVGAVSSTAHARTHDGVVVGQRR